MNNLVINADEAMPEGGVIHISVRNMVIREQSTLPLPRGDYVEIVARDNGAGISEENLTRIFEPYFTTKEKGSGLGLATTSSIIKNHDGHISVDSKLGISTTFHIYLPATRKLLISTDEETEDIQTIGTGRILVMDDEETVRKLVWRALTGIGYEVELSDDGADAIEKYIEAWEAEKPFDAVILDLTVPGGIGGKDTIKRLLEINPTIKAIASSGYSTDRIMSNYIEYGFTGVVAKPYGVSELRRTLRNVLIRGAERLF